MNNTIAGFSKLSKEEKINWIANNYFSTPSEAIDLLKYLVKGARIISLTGEQGCRKNNNAYGHD